MPKPIVKDAATSRSEYRKAWRRASAAADASWQRCRALYESPEMCAWAQQFHKQREG